jgi:asparagine synthetase B (glutamine-hydrolysing)
VETIHYAALCHDIGKIAQRPEVIRKPHALDKDERRHMMRHPEAGARIVGQIRALRPAAAMVRTHHWRPDGRGYPVGLVAADVPLGAFLSGGIDSSTVVAYMMETSDAPVVTTSVGFDVHAYDELEHAETVARHLGCEFHPQTADPQVADLLPKLARHFDEPFADSSAVPTYYVSKAARQLVTVALSGDGGDELWAGYARHRVERFESRARRWLGPAATAAG